MDIVKGYVALSKAGRDKGRFLYVLDVDGGYATVADGDLRKIAAPKKKKLKHLSATTTKLVFDQDELSDKKLRAALRERCGSDRQKEG